MLYCIFGWCVQYNVAELIKSHKDLKKGRVISIIYTATSVVMPRVVNYGFISSVSSNLPCVQCP